LIISPGLPSAKSAVRSHTTFGVSFVAVYTLKVIPVAVYTVRVIPGVVLLTTVIINSGVAVVESDEKY
jgi:hypothetical protein